MKVKIGSSLVGILQAKCATNGHAGPSQQHQQQTKVPPPPPDGALSLPNVNRSPSLLYVGGGPPQSNPISNSPSPPNQQSPHSTLNPADPLNFHPTPASDRPPVKPSASLTEISNWVESDILRGGLGVKYIIGKETVNIDGAPMSGRIMRDRKKKRMKKNR